MSIPRKLVVVIVALAGMSVAHADPITFTKIAETGGSITSVTSATINDSGVVAFRSFSANSEAILTGSGGTLDQIADNSGFIQSFSAPNINNDGIVAFNAGTDGGGGGVYATDGVSLTTISDESGPLSSPRNATISEAGDVAFTANFDAGGQGIFVGSGGPLTTAYDTSGMFSAFGDPTFNDNGTIAFLAGLDSGGAGIFSGTGGSATTIADELGIFSGFGGTTPDINNSGLVAFFAFLDSGEQGIFTGNGSVTNTIIDSSGVFSSFRAPNINDLGTVAFEIGAGDGIYFGSGSGITKVLAPGDELFGASVQKTFLSGSRHSLNNLDQIALWAWLDDGRKVVARADLSPPPNSIPVPEPGTLALLALGLAGIGVSRRKNGRRCASSPRLSA